MGRSTIRWKSASSLSPFASRVRTSTALALAARDVGLRVARAREPSCRRCCGRRRSAQPLMLAGNVTATAPPPSAATIAGVAGPRQRRVAGAGRVVDDGPVGVRGALRRGHDAELVGVDLEAGQRLLLQLAAADRLLLDRAAVDRLRRVGGAGEGGDQGDHRDDHRGRGSSAPRSSHRSLLLWPHPSGSRRLHRGIYPSPWTGKTSRAYRQPPLRRGGRRRSARRRPCRSRRARARGGSVRGSSAASLRIERRFSAGS